MRESTSQHDDLSHSINGRKALYSNLGDNEGVRQAFKVVLSNDSLDTEFRPINAIYANMMRPVMFPASMIIPMNRSSSLHSLRFCSFSNDEKF